MGRLAAESMAESGAPLDAILTWHIRSNHYPPLPMEYVDVALLVLAWADSHDPEDPATWDHMLDLPSGLNPLPRQAEMGDDGVVRVRVGTLVDILHLDSFIEWED